MAVPLPCFVQKIQNNLMTEMDVMDEYVFVKFEFKTAVLFS